MIKDCLLNTTRNHTYNSNVRIHLRFICALDHFLLSANVIRFKDFLLVFQTMPFPYQEQHHVSLVGNVFSTQKRLGDETTYKHTRNLFFKVIRKSLYRPMNFCEKKSILRLFQKFQKHSNLPPFWLTMHTHLPWFGISCDVDLRTCDFRLYSSHLFYLCRFNLVIIIIVLVTPQGVCVRPQKI